VFKPTDEFRGLVRDSRGRQICIRLENVYAKTDVCFNLEMPPVVTLLEPIPPSTAEVGNEELS